LQADIDITYKNKTTKITHAKVMIFVTVAKLRLNLLGVGAAVSS
jgi:hypothetical protein